LLTFHEEILGTRGLNDVALAWQEASGEEQFDLDAGALPGDAEMTFEVTPAQPMTDFSTTTTDRFADLATSPPELKVELPGTGKSAKTAAEISGLLGSGSANSGDGTASGKGKGYGRTQFFGVEAEGNKFVYVFDRSHSMASYDSIPMQAAKMELLSSIERLESQQQFYTVFYNHEPWLYEPPGSSRGRLQFATAENKALFREVLYRLRPDGGTRHMPGLEWAIKKRPDVIYLLTDGEEKDDLTNDELQRLCRMNSSGASIHVIQFTLESRPDSTLVQLAKRNRGKHTFIGIQRLIDRLVGASADPK
jgi:hypothetical protein